MRRGSSQAPVPAPQIACSFRTLYGPGYWSGPIPPSSPAIRESPALWTSSAGDSYARNKTSTRPRSCLLRPLPIPSRPWSHIALDFVTGLPTSEGNTTILTVIDRFSKATHLVALPKLPSSRETADLLVRNPFRLHGIPAGIVSFPSQVWRAFCAALGTTPSLSSGFVPQSNGQSEWANQEMEAALRCISDVSPSS